MDLLWSNAADFDKNGVAAVACILPKELAGMRGMIDDMQRKCPELHDDVENRDSLSLVAGGFGAWAHPSSFHSQFPRELRKRYLQTMRPKFLALSKHTNVNFNVELLFDRVMLRRAGQKPMSESFHRDVYDGRSGSTKLSLKDRIYGGWVNLDSTEQIFNCVPGSHKDYTLHQLSHSSQHTGFATIPKTETAGYYNRTKSITIPPGHLIIFEQNIIHEVVAKAKTSDSYRQFLGARLTTSTAPLFDLATVFEDFAVPRLPSGQQVPMYSANHQSCWIEKAFYIRPGQRVDGIVGWSKQFQPKALVTKTRKSGANQGQPYTVVERYFPSLRAMGLVEASRVAPYTQEERELYQPQPLEPLAARNATTSPAAATGSEGTSGATPDVAEPVPVTASATAMLVPSRLAPPVPHASSHMQQPKAACVSSAMSD